MLAVISSGKATAARTGAIRIRRRIAAWTVAIWLGSWFTAPPAWACCDTLLGCVGAVATGGVTCVLEAAANAIRDLIQRIQGERDAKSQAFNSGITRSLRIAEEKARKANDDAARAVETLRRAFVEARKLAADDKAWLVNARDRATVQQLPAAGGQAVPSAKSGVGVAVTRRPGTIVAREAPSTDKPSTVAMSNFNQLIADNSLEALMRQIEVLYQRGAEARMRANEAVRQAREKMAQATEATKKTFQFHFLNPIERLLASLLVVLYDPAQLGNVALVNTALALLDLAVFGYEKEVAAALERDAALMNAEHAKIEREAQEAIRDADKATQILEQMRKGVQLKTVVERRALANAVATELSASRAGGPSAVTVTAASAAYANLLNVRASFAKIRADLQRLRTPPKSPDLGPIRARMENGFDSYFRGKSAADVQKARDNLLNEARLRYGADPKVLAAVEKLIHNQARARGAYQDRRFRS